MEDSALSVLHAVDWNGMRGRVDTSVGSVHVVTQCYHSMAMHLGRENPPYKSPDAVRHTWIASIPVLPARYEIT